MTKPKPVSTASSTSIPSRPTVKTSIKPTRPSTVPKPPPPSTDPTSPDQQTTTILSTAPEGNPSASATLPVASKTTRTTKPLVKPPPTRVSTSKSTSTTVKDRPSSQTRTTSKFISFHFIWNNSSISSARPSTATTASTTTLPKQRSTSAHRPATADATTRAGRLSGADASASAGGTTVRSIIFSFDS